MKAYRVTGTFLMKDKWQEFSKEVAADNPAQAKEPIVSDLGSRHRAQRRNVKVNKIDEIPVEAIENPVVKWKVGGKK